MRNPNKRMGYWWITGYFAFLISPGRPIEFILSLRSKLSKRYTYLPLLYCRPQEPKTLPMLHFHPPQ